MATDGGDDQYTKVPVSQFLAGIIQFHRKRLESMQPLATIWDAGDVTVDIGTADRYLWLVRDAHLKRFTNTCRSIACNER